MTIESSCCSSLNCNQQLLSNDITTKCYVCDSRITGLVGCSTLNVSNLRAYRRQSSDSSELCAVSIV